jgi:DNA polymerase
VNYCFLDFETRSKVDLKLVGADNYARDPSTEVISIAYAIDHQEVQHVRKEQISQFSWRSFHTSCCYISHNIEFEISILRHLFGIQVGTWIDTMALAAQLSLPLSLEKLAEFFGLSKDMAGHKSMKKLSRPRPKSASNPNRDKFWEYDDKPEDWDAMAEYNENDVEVMRAIFYKLLPLTKREQRIWQMTREMNERGILVDVPAVQRALELVNTERATLDREFQDLVGCSPSSSVKVAEWCGLPDVTAQTVETALQHPLAPAKRRALQLRQLLSKSSLAKLDSFLLRASPDGRLRGSLVYAGAQRTGRWAGRGVQPQNFRRGMGVWSEVAVDCMVAGWSAESWLKLMPEMLRSFFKGPFIVGDYAQIEARLVAWLAGETKLLNEFREKRDIYKLMATTIYDTKLEKVTSEQRRIGKNTVLGCGYQMGPDRFVSQLAAQGVRDFPREIAAKAVEAYRSRYRKVPQFWWYINNQAMEAMYGRPNKWFETCSVHGVRYLRCRLPSGRHLYYPKPRLGTDPKFGTERIEYWGQNTYTRQWEFVGTYGGKLTENIVQATSRDLLADAMLRLWERGNPLDLTVHDEIVATKNGVLSAPQVAECMKQVPEWAAGLPVEVEVFECERYRK